MLLTLKKGIIYGPVNSRRLGRSLGINLMPATVKVCSFDCVYCQYGWTKVRALGAEGAGPVPKIDDVALAVKTALAALPSPPAYITFSGNGEPCLHPDFPEIVEAVRTVRDRSAPGTKTAILSNSSRVKDERIRQALVSLDVRIMKLDCGTEEVFRRYNGPAVGLTLDAVTEGLAELARSAPVTIQSLWSGGAGGNLKTIPSGEDLFPHPEISAWIGRLERIRPAFVQVYSLDRDTPAKDLRQLGSAELELIAAKARAIGLQAESFVRPA